MSIEKYFELNENLLPKGSTYFGGKGSSGTYQEIINLIPPHTNYIEPFLGYGSIFRKLLKKTGQNFYLNDIDRNTFNYWHNADINKTELDYNVSIHNRDYKDFLTHLFEFFDLPNADSFIFIDPPYPHSKRLSNTQYKFDFKDSDHLELFKTIDNLLSRSRIAKKYDKILSACQSCKNSGNNVIKCDVICTPGNIANNCDKCRTPFVMVCTYETPEYSEYFRHWNKLQYYNTTRKGRALETLYYNYDKPLELHDHRFIGTDFRDRELIKKSLKSTIRKLEQMDSVKRAAILNYFQL